ncbi:MFS transporter [Saccharopolyspora pogona]|uniref:MFS transporter n=1 Tax=Saccharopolyspora pogona TaxID=333966 RepID=UPI001682ECC4|nr:MFS transporter [Saccharopolyspora pogona]
MKKAFVASIVGTIIEWYDFFLYAAVAGLVINHAFFPNVSPVISTIASLSTFAVGFIARPLGAMIFGHLGDKIGRKRVLSATLVLMGSATLVTGLLPTYETIGLAAPIILVAMRVLQGIGVGGEYGGAILMISEQGYRTRRRGLLTSFPSASASVGFLLSSATMALMTAATTSEQFQSWGWRIPFVASAALLGFGYWIRRSVAEPPAFADAKQAVETVRSPLVEIFRRFPRQVYVSIALPVCIAVSYSLVLVYMVTYATGRGTDGSSLLGLTTLAQTIYLPLIIGWGFTSDHLGRRKPMAFGMIGTAAWAFAFWPLIGTGSWGLMLLAVAVGLFFISAMYGPQAAFLAELFPVEVRYSGISFGYQVAFAVAGGLTPVVALTLQTATGSWVPAAVMTGVGAAISLSALVVSRGIKSTTDHGRTLANEGVVSDKKG